MRLKHLVRLILTGVPGRERYFRRADTIISLGDQKRRGLLFPICLAARRAAPGTM